MNTCPCSPMESSAKGKMLPQSFPKWGSMMKIFYLLSQPSETIYIRGPTTAFWKYFTLSSSCALSDSNRGDG